MTATCDRDCASVPFVLRLGVLPALACRRCRSHLHPPEFPRPMPGPLNASYRCLQEYQGSTYIMSRIAGRVSRSKFRESCRPSAARCSELSPYCSSANSSPAPRKKRGSRRGRASAPGSMSIAGKAIALAPQRLRLSSRSSSRAARLPSLARPARARDACRREPRPTPALRRARTPHGARESGPEALQVLAPTRA